MTGIFYGSSTGMTEALAGRIAEKLGIDSSDVHNVADASADAVGNYDLLLLGSSTWGAGELQDDWYSFVDELKTKDLSGKRVAFFGCGDSESFPDTFCDALGILRDELAGTGCTFVGAYAPEDYAVTDSSVCRDGLFVGLAADETNESDKTDARIDRWTANF